MKKTLNILFVSLIFVFMLAACNASDDISYFLPLEYNILLTYEIEGQATSWQTFNVYLNDNRLQRRSVVIAEDESRQALVEVLEIQDNSVVLINTSQTTGNINLTNLQASIHSTILQKPLTLNNIWHETPFNIEAAAIREITGTDISVTTPAGTFQTIEVTSVFPLLENQIEPLKIRQYFAQGLGVVMEIAYQPTLQPDQQPQVTRTHLVSIERNTSFTEYVPIFLENSDIVLFPIVYNTNNSLPAVYTQFAHNALHKLFDINLSENTYVNFVLLNPDSLNLTIDLSYGFLEDMAQVISEAQEQAILQAIINILGWLYGAEAVYISVDGQPYSGPFISLNLMQFLPVRLP